MVRLSDIFDFVLEIIALTTMGGSMFIPVDDDSHGYSQTVWRIEKDEKGSVSRHRLYGVRYVPLTDPPKKISGIS